MTYEIDPNTGLPALPEGYFWRVSQGVLSLDQLEIRKKSWLGSYRIDRRIVLYYDEERNVLNPADEILRVAHRMMDEFHNPWGSFYGDYPPKKLEQK